MRISLIDPSLFTLPYDAALAQGLSRAGHDVTLHARALRPEDGSAGGVAVAADFYRLAEHPRVSRLPTKFRLGVKGLDHAWSMLGLLARLRRERPDVIHFQWLPLPILDARLLGLFRRVAPLVLTVHDTNPYNGDPSASLQARGFLQALLRFDRLVVHTAQGEARLRRLGVPAQSIMVRPHGLLVQPASFAPDPMQGVMTFLLFGKIKPYKGADLLIRAFADLPADLRQAARIRIVGKPYMDLAPLHALASTHGVPLSIESGFVRDEDIPALFGPGTVAVFPYREIEASGVLSFALAHGRPMIAARLGSFAELLENDVHGRLHEPEDVAALTGAMATMIGDRAYAAGCADAVRALTRAIPDWDEIARQTLQTYLAAGTARPGGMAGLGVASGG